MPFFKPRFRSLDAEQRLEAAKTILATTPDGARLLALAEKHCIEICPSNSGSYGGLGQPLHVTNHDDLASYVMTLTHELRHLEQDVTFGLFNKRFRLKPAEQALAMRMVEADAFAFSAAVVHQLLKNGTLRGAFCNDRLYMEQKKIKKIFATVAQKKSLQTDNLIDVYKDTALNFSQGFMGYVYDFRSLNLYSHMRMDPSYYEAKLPVGTALAKEYFEGVFDMNVSIPLPGNLGLITLGEMLESAIATISPRMYALFARAERSHIPQAQPVPKP